MESLESTVFNASQSIDVSKRTKRGFNLLFFAAQYT